MLDQKAGNVIAVKPHHTSQACHECGTVGSHSRWSQAEFHCVACGHRASADLNAVASGATARGGGGDARPVTREINAMVA